MKKSQREWSSYTYEIPRIKEIAINMLVLSTKLCEEGYDEHEPEIKNKKDKTGLDYEVVHGTDGQREIIRSMEHQAQLLIFHLLKVHDDHYECDAKVHY